MRFYWSDEFMKHLDVGGSPMFAMDFDDDIGLGEFGATLPVRLVLHSHGVSAGDNHIPHAIESVSGSGQSVSIRQWGNRFGSLTLRLAGVDMAELVARRIPMGLPCKFKVGVDGMSFADWETVGIYRFDGLTGSRNRWQMKFGDLGKVLQAAISRTTTSSTAIFSEFETSNAISSKFNPAVGGFTISANPVTGVSGLVKDTEAGARGLLYCQRTDGPGDPFYLKYTGISGLTITPVHHDVMGTDRPFYTDGGLAVDADHKIEHVNYIHDDLPRLVEKFLLDNSEATGTMPDGHNMGFQRAGLFNSPDWDLWRTRWERYSSFKADLYTLKTAQNPYRILGKTMAELGAWLVMKEGRLSWRFAYDIGPTSPVKVDHDFEIVDQDIISVDRYELFSSDAREQVVALRFLDGVRYTYVTANPAIGDRVEDKRADAVVYDDDVDTSNRANAKINLEDRLSNWYTSIPDTLTLNLRGWRWLHMVPGDVALVNSQYIPDLFAREGGTKLTDQRFMVTSVNCNWRDFSCTVELSRPRFLSAFSS